MSKSKGHKLQLELKDISGIPAGLTQCKIEVAGFSSVVDSKTPMVCVLDEVSLTTVITITLSKSGESVGICRVSFNAMFGESLSGKSEKWVRLKEVNPSGRDLKVKLCGTLGANVPSSQKAKPSISDSSPKFSQSSGVPTLDLSISKPRTLESIKCPFIEKVAKSEETAQKLETMWNKREFLGDLNIEKTIRITLEPETLNKPGAEVITASVTSLDTLDLTKLKDLGGFQLKKLLKSLSEEVKTNSCSSLNLPLARNSLALKIQERLDKHQEAEDLSRSIKETSSSKAQELSVLLEERKNLMETLQKEEENCRLVETQVDSLKSSIALATSENLRLRAECLRYGDADKVHRELQAQVKEGLMRKSNLEKSFLAVESQLKSLKEKTESQKERLKKEKEELAGAVRELAKRKDSALSDNNYLKRQLNDIKQRMNTEQNIKALLKEARQNSAMEGSRRDQVYYDLQEFIHSMQSQIEDFKNKHKNLIANRKNVCQSISSLEHELENKEHLIIDLKRKIIESSSNQIALEEMYCIKSDVSSMIEELGKVQKIHNEGRDVILKGLEEGVEYVMKESDQVIEETRELDCMIDSLDNKDYELDNLKIMVGEAKTRSAPYMPAPDDPVDVALSEYLNSLDNPIQIPFTRENEGVYLFGTKRIFLKLENNNIKIRVGGGYTNIEEFIEIYTSTELERQEEAIEESAPNMAETLTRFSGKPGMSPQRAARIIHSTVEANNGGSPLKPVRRRNK